ncbi:thiamine phosphate synthase [Aureivirga sp. CE67]|uniref:thiamine phosphate synthase n=1 Tax=Aureivirga sp. CE67 TaxID=1788983 RepID=UPI0018CB9C95|nr:thiamine phosphate synthase [Aureivirga sp. CE67]
MIIPKLHYKSQGNTPEEHLENIQKACTSGAELVQLCLENISDKKFLKIAEKAREITGHFQTRLLIQDDYKIAKEIKADGVFLEKSISNLTNIRKELNVWQIIGAKANTLQNCKSLIKKEVDYICLGPFKNTKEQNTDLDLQAYSLILEELETKTPILGFGNIELSDVENILETGVSGLVISDAITSDFNNITKFHQLLKASSTDEQRYTF